MAVLVPSWRYECCEALHGACNKSLESATWIEHGLKQQRTNAQCQTINLEPFEYRQQQRRKRLEGMHSMQFLLGTPMQPL